MLIHIAIFKKMTNYCMSINKLELAEIMRETDEQIVWFVKSDCQQADQKLREHAHNLVNDHVT